MIKRIIFRLSTIAFLFVLLIPSISLSSQDRRIALVIGNGAYKFSPLRNPVNDANDMAVALEKCKFNVVKITDANRGEMRKAIRKFGNKLMRGGIGLFYYAGHGIQVNGENYLVPVGAEVFAEDEVEDECLKVSSVLRKMETANNSLNIIILDACRDNPFGRSFRSGKSGLAKMDAPTGSILAYATAPGSVAADGTDRNGLYTSKLLKHMTTQGITIENLFKRVRVDVMNASGKRQVPWESSSLAGNFYFYSKRGITIAESTALKSQPVKETPEIEEKTKDELELALLKIKKLKEAQQKEKEAKGRKFKNLLADLKKYQTIEKSDLDDETKYSAWKAMKRKYPKWSSGIGSGDSTGMVYRALEEDNDGTYAEIAKASGFELSKTNSIGMEFVYIKPGSFMMGSPSNESGRDDDEVQHRVSITKSFYIQTTEVTQGQWKAVMGSNPSHFKNCGDDCPVENVSWNDVKEFIHKLNQREGSGTYRLPSEAEWEYAARAGTDTPFSFGRCLSTDQANYHGNYPLSGCAKGKYRNSTIRVASFSPNAWGLYDMHGNVYEWCQDWYAKYYSSSATDPTGPSSGSYRVIRGGGWLNYARVCRSANRVSCTPGYRGYDLGFRLLRTL